MLVKQKQLTMMIQMEVNIEFEHNLDVLYIFARITQPLKISSFIKKKKKKKTRFRVEQLPSSYHLPFLLIKKKKAYALFRMTVYLS